jgi:acetyltransferase-like isoleucine patch superfamily enzyme
MNAHKIIEKLFTRVKKEEVTISYPFSLKELLVIINEKGWSLVRGFLFVKPFLKKSKGFIFSGKGAKVQFGHKIKVGSGLNLMEHSTINALSYDGVEIGNNFTLGKYCT